MGSPLGPTFANWFLGYLEEKIFEEHDEFYPKFYCRYVDDNCAVFSSLDHVQRFLEMLNSQHPNAEFTVEMTNGGKQLPFLDVEVKLADLY